MSGRTLILLLLGTMGIALVAFSNVFQTTNTSGQNMAEYFLRQQAHNISQTGINMAIRQMANNLDYRDGFTIDNLFNGQLTVTLIDTVFASFGDSVVKIESRAVMAMGTEAEDTITATSIAIIDPTVFEGFIPVSVMAAVSTNNNIATLGNLIIDGRDHDINGNVIPGQGTYGIWTTQGYNRGGDSKIGSSVGGLDYVPQKNENDNLRLENQTYPGGGYPTTPDSIMGGTSAGFSSGTLKSLALAGNGGSQYVTDPANLTYPLSGVTYVELPTETSGNQNIWNSANIEGGGILIVHNSATNAVIANINSGTFKGLMIVDDVVRVHGDIIGALIGLTSNPSEGNCLGNGNGNILYSQEAIKAATSEMGGEADSTETLYSNVLAWWD